MMTGSDVLNVQKMLSDDGYSCPVNGVFDEATKNAVKMFQSKNNISHINGVVDQETYNALVNKLELPEDIIYYGTVINKSGAAVYSKPEAGASVMDTLTYGDIIPIYDIKGNYYVTETGYVIADNIWGPDTQNANVKEYTLLEMGDEGAAVRVLQNALKTLGLLNSVSGIYDNNTFQAVDSFQYAHDLIRTGKADMNTWMLIHESVSELFNTEIGFSQTYSKVPGRYVIDKNNIFIDINGFNVDIQSHYDVNVKRTCNVFYDDGYVGFLSNVKSCKIDTLKLQDLSDAFIYNIKHGYPRKIEYVVCPYGHTPHKYIFTFEQEVIKVDKESICHHPEKYDFLKKDVIYKATDSSYIPYDSGLCPHPEKPYDFEKWKYNKHIFGEYKLSEYGYRYH